MRWHDVVGVIFRFFSTFYDEDQWKSWCFILIDKYSTAPDTTAANSAKLRHDAISVTPVCCVGTSQIDSLTIVVDVSLDIDLLRNTVRPSMDQIERTI